MILGSSIGIVAKQQGEGQYVTGKANPDRSAERLLGDVGHMAALEACPAGSSLFLQVRTGLRLAREQCRGQKESRHARRSICLTRTPLAKWPERGWGGDGANMPRLSTQWRQI